MRVARGRGGGRAPRDSRCRPLFVLPLGQAHNHAQLLSEKQQMEEYFEDVDSEVGRASSPGRTWRAAC